MKANLVTLIVLLALSTYVRAQEKTNYGLLKVKGESSMEVPPDETVARFQLDVIRLNYKETVTAIGKKADEVVKVVKKLGYSGEDVKTTNFNVSINYVFTYNHRQDSGFIAHQTLQIDFPYNSKSIIDLINAVSASASEPQLTFLFRLSDARLHEVKNKLISMAVKDARQTAETIAGAAGTGITGIEEIVYGTYSEPGPQLYRMKEAMSPDDSSYGGFNVQDQSYNESIEISFRIKPE